MPNNNPDNKMIIRNLDQRKTFESFIMEFQDMFASKKFTGRTSLVQH